MEMKKKATIVDVAKEAGVSVATVSRVVNGNYPVKPETRERVQSAINALQYVPNVQARELNTRHSSTIGVVVPGLYNMFFAEVIDGIEKSMRRQGYSLLLNCAQNDPELEMECINALVSRSVSGIIVISPNTEGLREEFYRRIVKRVPLVFINGYHRIPNVSYVANDEALGTRQALEYLTGLGHKHILFVRGENSDSYTVKERAYRAFMAEQGLFNEKDIVDIGEGNNIDTVTSARIKLMKVMPELAPTAVFCCNDLMATGAHPRLQAPRPPRAAGRFGRRLRQHHALEARRPADHDDGPEHVPARQQRRRRARRDDPRRPEQAHHAREHPDHARVDRPLQNRSMTEALHCISGGELFYPQISREATGMRALP